MAGHSKWANIQHRKKAQDNKRGKVFTKVIREITVATKLAGPDINSNSRLRLALSKANSANVPKDTIERAIKKASGQSDENYEEITYEGYGPKGVAIIIECLTDNKNRTVSEVRNVLSKNGGSLGTKGSVAHLFRRVGVMKIERMKEDDLFDHMDSVELLDVEQVENGCIIITKSSELFNTKKYFETHGFSICDEEIIMDPQTQVDVPNEDKEKVLSLSSKIEELDDVQNVYMNVSII
ncbi:MAG: YebC/PmpR family DNA-binding transcriptional regulator [Pseudomonadota bacterium]|nr:YebC/PmpR family DNA-binding transcriptional regulator [Pseudomonadota bacterium]